MAKLPDADQPKPDDMRQDRDSNADHIGGPVVEIQMEIDASILSTIICERQQDENECEKDIQLSLQHLNQSKPYCKGEFDNGMCWSHAEAGRSAEASCPGFSWNVGYRYCMPNGSWFRTYDEEAGKLVTWTRIDDCKLFGSEGNGATVSEANELVTLSTNLRVLFEIGYGMSIGCLVVAIILLACFRKLRCTRNYIHMNLMVSYILRYNMKFIRKTLLLAHYQLNDLAEGKNLNYDQLHQYCNQVMARCRLVSTLMHYAVMVNSFWLLAEGLFLGMLLASVVPKNMKGLFFRMLLASVVSKNTHVSRFMVVAWGAPWIFVIIWVVLRVHFENRGCWNTNDKMYDLWMISVPVIICNVMNFFIFIIIVRLIAFKLRRDNMVWTDSKMHLAKSTLQLVPLLGIHYILFLILYVAQVQTKKATDIISTRMALISAFDGFLFSVQGMLVSILYCFMNEEVRTEVRRAYDQRRNLKNLPKSFNCRKARSQLRHSTNGGDISAQENCQSSKSTDSV